MLLAVLLGSGVQVFCMSLITLAFACLGFLSPANRGSLMTCAMVLFVLLGTPAGYVSARVYKSFGGIKWKSNVMLTSIFSPGIVFGLFFVMNLVLWDEESSGAVPFLDARRDPRLVVWRFRSTDLRRRLLWIPQAIVGTPGAHQPDPETDSRAVDLHAADSRNHYGRCFAFW